ncbi:hypothetical protein IFM89_036749 [Coptis chinensis]|uniref:Uncharacterized protein n=1 Tax=Coptis chinensis TaxID=261450 RepID=A0A835LXW3_9MAGN|nr:hypothetical protein IFM89_036749 [Coptis chinensis]
MGSLCSKQNHYNEADLEENAQAAEIERRIAQETKTEKHIQKILLLGCFKIEYSTFVRMFLWNTKLLFPFIVGKEAGESGKSTIFKQIKLLFQTGFDETELNSYVSVIHANLYQTIKVCNNRKGVLVVFVV